MSLVAPREVETLVVGAGPAGALAAMFLARAGREVLLAEQRPAGAGKVCGEYVGREGTAVLQRHDLLAPLLAAGAASIASTRVHDARGGCFASTLGDGATPQGLGVSRRLLDAALQEAARRVGAELIEEARLTGLRRERGRWRARFLRRGENLEVLAAQLIGADGRNSRVAQLCGLPGRFVPGGVGLQLHFAAAVPLTDQVELFLFPGGYAGLAPIERSRCCLGALIAGPGTSADPFDFLSGRLAGGDFPGAIFPAMQDALDRATTFPVRLGHRRAIGDQLLLAGDAACVTDPFIGQGIALALMGGEAAAQSILLSSHAPARGERCYREFLHREVFPRAVTAAALRRLLAHPDLTSRLLRVLARRPALAARMVALTRNAGPPWLRALPRAAAALAFRSRTTAPEGF